jgi:predicted dehydrogenase
MDVIAWRARGRPGLVTDQLTLNHDVDLAAHYGIRLVPTLEDGLAENPTLTFVCNPTSLHVPVALAALRAGSHVFVEKPLSNTMEGVEELLAEAEGRRKVVYVGYQLRFHPAICRLRDALKTEAIGRIAVVRAVVGEYLPNFHRYEDYRSTYAARRDLGGGVVLSQIHELDYLSSFFGMPRRLFAIGGHLSDLEIDVEDVAAILLDCGQTERPLPISLQMDFLQRPRARNCEVVGSEGKITVDLLSPSFIQFGTDGAETGHETWPDFDRNAMFLDQLRHFLAACEGSELPLCTASDGARSLAIALAILRSLKSGKVVDIRHDQLG